MKITPIATLAILAAGLALAGCQKSTTDAQADAIEDGKLGATTKTDTSTTTTMPAKK